MLERGYVVGCEGADAPFGGRHERRYRVVGIRRERLIAPGRAPVRLAPGVERLAILGAQATHRKSAALQARLLVGRIPIARRQVDMHIDRIAAAPEAEPLEEAERRGVAYVQAGPDVVGHAVPN